MYWRRNSNSNRWFHFLISARYTTQPTKMDTTSCRRRQTIFGILRVFCFLYLLVSVNITTKISQIDDNEEERYYCANSPMEIAQSNQILNFNYYLVSNLNKWRCKDFVHKVNQICFSLLIISFCALLQNN